MVGVAMKGGADKLCLHYHHSLSKTAKLWLQEQFFLELKRNWWAHQDLNLGPIDYESTALTN